MIFEDYSKIQKPEFSMRKDKVIKVGDMVKLLDPFTKQPKSTNIGVVTELPSGDGAVIVVLIGGSLVKTFVSLVEKHEKR